MASLCRLLRGGLAQLIPIQTLTRPNHHLASLRCITRSQSTRISSLALLSTRNSHCIGQINNGYTQCHSVVRGMRTSSLLCDTETGNKYFRQTASLFPSLYQKVPYESIEKVLPNGDIQLTNRDSYFYEEYLRRKLQECNVFVGDRNFIPHSWMKSLQEATTLCKRIDQSQGMMMLYLSSMVKEVAPGKRLQLTKDIWKSLRREGLAFEMTPTVYNTYLDAILQNKGKLDDDIVLKVMEERLHVLPDVMTYQLLIKNHCQEGDMEAASKILSYMQQRGFSMESWIFDTLIYGHMKNKDYESAEAIINSMNEADLRMTSDTYETIIRSYANNGMIEEMFQKIDECTGKGLFSGNVVLFELIGILSEKGDTASVQRIFSILNPDHVLFWKDLTRATIDLVAQGQVETAVELRRWAQPYHQGNDNMAIIRSMAICNYPIDQIEKVYSTLYHDGAQSTFIGALISGGVIYQDDSGYSLQVFRYLDSKPDQVTWNAPLATAILTAAIKEKSKDDILSVWRNVFCQDIKDAITVEGLYELLLQPLFQMKTSNEEIMEFLQENISITGSEQFEWIKIILDLRHSRVPELTPEAMQQLKDMPDMGESLVVGDLIANVVMRTGRASFAIEALKLLQQIEEAPSSVLTQSVVMHRCFKNSRWNSRDLVVIDELLDGYKENNIQLTWNHLWRMIQILKDNKIWYGYNKRIQDIPIWHFKGETTSRSRPLHFMSLSIDELEKTREEMQLTPVQNSMLLTSLLHKYAQNWDLDKAREMFDELDMVLDSCSRNNLILMALVSLEYFKDIPRSEKYCELLAEENPWESRYLSIVLNQAMEMCREGRVQDAIDRLESLRKSKPSRHSTFRPVYSGLNQEITSLDACCRVMVNSLINKRNLAGARELLTSLWGMKFISERDFAQHGLQIVRHLVQMGELDEALELYSTCTRYEKAASSVQLYTALLKSGRIEDFDRVTERLSERLPKEGAALRVALSYLLAGQRDKANEMLENLAPSATQSLVEDGVVILESIRDLSAIEAFYSWRKSHHTKNLRRIQSSLISAYVDAEDAPSAYKFLTEEDVQCSLESLSPSLRALFQRYDLEVPKCLEKTAIAAAKNPSSVVRKFHFNHKFAEQALKEAIAKDRFLYMNTILSSAEAQNFKISDVMVAKVIADEAQSKSVPVLRKMLWALANEKRYSILKSLSSFYQKMKHRHLVDSILLASYIKHEDYEQLFDDLTSDPSFLVAHLNSKHISVLPKEKLMPVLEDAHEKGIDVMHKVVSYYVANGNIDELRVLFTKYPDLKDTVQVYGIFSQINECLTSYRDTETIEQVVELFKGSRNHANVSNEAILKRCNLKQSDRAQNLLQAALEGGCSEAALRPSSTVLKDLLNFENTPLELPQSV